MVATGAATPDPETEARCESITACYLDCSPLACYVKKKYTSVSYKPLYFRTSLLKQFSLFHNLYFSLLSRFPWHSLPYIGSLTIIEAKNLSHLWSHLSLHSYIQVTIKSYCSVTHNYLEIPISHLCTAITLIWVTADSHLTSCNSFRASFHFLSSPQCIPLGKVNLTLKSCHCPH